ncbi:MAG: hypothetical protein KBT02_00395 [Treponema sp.]|nr:hypothetical protein [Candidatus Treponema caballi]
MSAYSKTIHILDQKNTSLKKELASEETQIGFIYLDDTVCTEEDKKHYEELKADFQHLMANLAEIKSLETKKKELSADIQNVKAELAGLVTKESGLMLTLGIALYGQSGAASVPSFSKAYEEASSYADKVTSLKTQCEQMTESLELQNVFSRVVSKMKINSLSMSINSQQKKLDSALVAGAKAVVDSQDLPDELKCPAYETCVAFKNDWNKKRIELEALQDEFQNVEVTLADFGKKTLVQEKADAKNAEIETFALQAGHLFDKKYITRDGEMLTEFPAKYAEPLAKVLSLRTELASVNRRIDILQYSEQIDAAEDTEDSLKKEVAANEERIRKLEAENDSLKQRIRENAAAAEDLRTHRGAVEKEEGVSAADLLDDYDIDPDAVRPAERVVESVKKTAKKAAGAVKKATSKKTGKSRTKDGEAIEPDDEEAEFLSALNAAKASAAADGKEAE